MLLMKKVLLSVLSILTLTFAIQAQDITPAKALKKAGKALSSYNLDPSGNQDKIQEAASMISTALAADEMKENPAAWLKASEIFNALANGEQNALAFAQMKGDSTFKLGNLDAPVKALEASQMALKFAKKKFQTKGALKNIQETVGYLNLFANSQLGKNADYKAAYPLLNSIITARQLLIDNGKKDIFTTPEDAQQNQLLTAYAASQSGEDDRAMELFDGLINDGTKEVQAYTMYYNILSAAGKAEKADEVLAKAKKEFPTNKDVLFAEINKYLKAGQYEILEGKLKEAIAAEPGNASVYNVQGDVYQNLYAAALESGNQEKATQYFNDAISNYQKALEIKPDLTHATYSIGSVYYNKAAAIVPAMNALGTSKEETKKYDALKIEMEGLFDKALPYFLQAEASDKNDLNTLIALKEIYARKNDFTKSGEYKKRIEALSN